MGSYKKKLIEVALPLEAINVASAREKSIRHGHPSTLHLWWARRPLAAARAVIFAQMVDDPSGHPERFPTEAAQERERQRLFRLIEELVKWENTTNETVLQQAREEIWQSWRLTCAENRDHPRAAELFNPDKLPAFHDPFAGGGSLPLEAQRLGLESYASDLNPVAVLINKAMIEIPPKFAGRAPVNPEARRKLGASGSWRGAQGLAEDVRYYGKWMRDEAEKRIGHLYPKIEITAEMAKERPDLKSLVGRKLTVIAWLWARTVKSPNPAFSQVDVPLVGSFSLCRKKGNEAWINPVVRYDKGGYDFVVRLGGTPTHAGTVSRIGGVCLMSGSPMPFEYIRAEAKAGRMGQRLMAIVAQAAGKKVYLSPVTTHEVLETPLKTVEGPSGCIPEEALGIRVQLYGIREYSALFNSRQLVFLQTLCQLIRDVGAILSAQPTSSRDYAFAIQTYLALAVGRYADYGSTMTYWDDRGPSIQKTFGLPTLQMRWSYPETNPFENFSGNLAGMVEGIGKVLEIIPTYTIGQVKQADATSYRNLPNLVVSTDPPYYDNIGYAALSDYFYIWLKQSLRDVYPDIFATILTPKESELIAEPGRHGSREAAAHFFEERFGEFARILLGYSHPAYPTTIYYAFKQSELDRDGENFASTGWEVFLGGLIDQGWEIQGTWPMRTEQIGGLRLVGRNSLASSIILVCRPRPHDAPITTRRDFLKALKRELPDALKKLQHGNIAPVDMAQATIGPGMAILTRYNKVLESDDSPMKVRTALQLINQALDEYLSEQEGEYDPDTRFAITWFETHGMNEGPYGVAETLATARGVAVSGVQEAGILVAKGGKVRLLKREEMPENWNPATDTRLTVWEATQQLIRTMETKGEAAAGALIIQLGSIAETARDLAYRLYGVCEKKKWAEEALAYNGLVIAWPELTRLAAQGSVRRPVPGDLEF